MLSNAAMLSRLVVSEQLSLRRMVARMVHRDNLEDTLQALWLRIQRVEDHPPINDKLAFLYYLARKVALDQGRAEARQKRLNAEIEAIVWGADFVRPLDEVMIAKDDYARVLAAAEAMPEPMKTIFFMNRMDEIPQREIARRLGVSRTTVEKHIRKALARLGDALEGR